MTAPPGRQPVGWLAALLAVSAVIFALAFVLPALEQESDEVRALRLAAAAARDGELVVFEGPAQVLLGAGLPADVAAVAVTPGAALPRGASVFGRVLVVGRGQATMPQGVTFIERRRVGEAEVVVVRPEEGVRPLAQIEDVFGKMRVETALGGARQPCQREGGRYVCPQAGGAAPVALEPGCVGEDGALGVVLRPLAGQEVLLSVTQPHDLERIELQHRGAGGPQEPGLTLHLDAGAVRKVLALRADAPLEVLRPTRDVDLVARMRPRGDGAAACVAMTWWGDFPGSLDDWPGCVAAGRRALEAGAQPEAVLGRYVRGTSNLSCAPPGADAGPR